MVARLVNLLLVSSVSGMQNTGNRNLSPTQRWKTIVPAILATNINTCSLCCKCIADKNIDTGDAKAYIPSIWSAANKN
jgi:hypothetical protein